MNESCLDALLKLQPYLDGELPDIEADGVRRHFDVCGPCSPALGYFRNLREAVRRAAANQRDAPEHLRDRIRRLLEGGPEV